MKQKRALAWLVVFCLMILSWPVLPVRAVQQEPQPVLKVSFDQMDARDESPAGNHGTLVGNPEFVEGFNGKGKAIRFNNPEDRNQTATQYVDFGAPDALKFGTGDFTVMFWYKSDPSHSKEGAILSNKDWASGDNAGFNIGDMVQGVNANFNTVGKEKNRAESDRFIIGTDKTWHHIAVVVDRTGSKQMSLYIDGLEAVGGTGSFGTVRSYYADIAAYTTSVDVYGWILGADGVKKRGVRDAAVDDLAMYDQALTKVQLQQKIQEDIGANDPGAPGLQVSFDEMDARDASAAGNHGTMVGNPTFVEGVKGKAIRFDNPEDRSLTATQYVDFGAPDALKFGTGDFTVMFWYKSDPGHSKEGAILSNKDWVTGDNAGFNIGDMVEGVNANFNTVGSGRGRAETDRFLKGTDNSWRHIAVVVDRTAAKQIRLYIDGTEAVGGSGKSGSKSYYADIAAYTTYVDVYGWVLGADGVKKRGIRDGCVDELMMYDQALNKFQLQEIVSGDQAYLEVTKMEQHVGRLHVGSRYTADAVAAIQAEISQTKVDLAVAMPAERMELVETLRASFEGFLDGEEAVMSFHLVSDIHVTADANSASNKNFVAGLQDMKSVNPSASALISAGDNTQDARPAEFERFYTMLEENNPVPDTGVMIALGNHDVRGPDSSKWESRPAGVNAYWETAYQLYMTNNERYMPETQGKPYYDRWIDGYHFIVLNPENAPKDTTWLSETQLEWLEEKLAEDASPEKPIFVVIHQALADSHWRSNVYDGFGPQDGAVKGILARYPQAVVCSGHIHNGFGVAEVLSRPYGTLVDVPSFNYNSVGLSGAGMGYEVYVHEDGIYFRARNFAQGIWLPEYDVSLPLPALPAAVNAAKNLRESDYTADSWLSVKSGMDETLSALESLMTRQYDQSSLSGAGAVLPPAFLYHQDTRAQLTALQNQLDSAVASLVEAPRASLTGPEEVIKNEVFELTFHSDEAYDKLTVYNEVGRFVSSSVVSQVENADGSFTVVLRLSVGTAGDNRTLSVYSGETELASHTFRVLPIPAGILGVTSPETALRGETFAVTVTTTSDLIKVKFYNENGGVLGSTRTSRVVKDGVAVATYEMNVGTAGDRTITIKADFDKQNEFPFASSFDIQVTKAE